jgi:mannose-binding lectin 1
MSIQRFSQDRHTIRGYQIFGDPQILSDRLVLTPPSPGNQRVGLYTNKPNPYNEWSVDIDFRTSGGERPGGSFHFWYTAGGASGKGGLESVYTSKPFDGLALVVDSYGGVCSTEI